MYNFVHAINLNEILTSKNLTVHDSWSFKINLPS